MDFPIILGSAVVGLLVGLTGAGGGALMTPMLILIFSVRPSSAISSDLVATLFMRPVGAAIHMRSGTVNFQLVGWMSAGSVPAAFAGTYVLHLLGKGTGAQGTVEIALGAALLVGAGAMALRYGIDRRTGQDRDKAMSSIVVHRLPTLGIGVIGGFVVGITSVGAGSLMVVLLMFLYPTLSAKRLVGTDLAQAIPLTAAAAFGSLIFGHVLLTVTTAVIAGGIPGVIAGSLLATRVPDRFLRPVVGLAIFGSGLKYVGVGSVTLGWILLGVVVAGAAAYGIRATIRQRSPQAIGARAAAHR